MALSRWRSAVAKLSDRRGSMAMMYALALPAVIGAVGLAVDFGNAGLSKSQLKLAADSAALLATTTASNAYLAGSTDAAAMALAKTAATNRFNAQAGALAASATPVVTLTSNGGQFQATVQYTAAIPTQFARVIGVDSLPVDGSSGSQISTNGYVSISVLMDASSSMLIAATQNDIDTLETLTGHFSPPGNNLPSNVAKDEACGFACHWTTQTGKKGAPQDYYQLAQQNNVQLRLNVLQNSTTSLINSIAGLDKSNDFTIGLYTFNKTLNTIYAVGNDFSAALSSVSSIQPDVNTCDGNACPETYFAGAMSSLAQQTAASGSGVSASSPKKFLFIITDGVADYVDANGVRQVNAIGITDCNAMKAKNVTILVLYTTYTPLPDNAFYNEYVAPHIQDAAGINEVEANLKACASPPPSPNSSYFFEATDSTGIATQINNMFQLVQQTQSHLID